MGESSSSGGQVAADASTSSSSSSSSGAPSPVTPTTDACRRFHPGHYFRETDSRSGNQDGLAHITADFGPGGLDLTDFAGLLYQIDWAMLEPSPGVYDFSRLDAVMAIVKKAGKFLRVKIMERSFWAGCNPPVPIVPSYVTNFPAASGVGCFADVWAQATMDRLIALHVAIVKHFQADSSFVGFNTEETATNVAVLQSNPSLVTAGLYPQRVRLAQAVLAAASDVLFISEFNWPINNDLSHFSTMIDSTLQASPPPHNGMGVSWPDSFLNPGSYTAAEQSQTVPKLQCTASSTASGKTPCTWYNLARTYNTKVVVAPNIQGGTLTGTLAEADAHYAMLDTDLGAHMITWETWSAPNANYLRQIAIPTVRKHQGKLRNTACPFK